MGLAILLILIVLLICSIPIWPYNSHWGNKTAGVFVGLLIVFLLLALTGEIDIY